MFSPRNRSHAYNARGVLLPIFAVVAVACAAPTPNGIEVDEGSYSAHEVVGGLERPWGLDFLRPQSADQALVTERAGGLQLIDLAEGTRQAVGGEVPEVVARGQGGMLDVAVHPEYGEGDGENDWIYLTYSGANDNGSGYATHLGRARFNPDDASLFDFEVLYVAEPFHSQTGHFGSRIIFDTDGYLYMTSGDRRERDSAQDLSSNWGKIFRFHDDGSIPDDNPFVGDPDALDAIYTYGHRNPQGLAIHPQTGDLWQNEHGERDGDEINIIDTPGGNYGWPVAVYDREYVGGAAIGDLPHERDDIINPIYWWDGTRYDDGQSGFPPSGIAFTNDGLFMGNLANQYLGWFHLDGTDRSSAEVTGESRILGGYGRVRDVRSRENSDALYVLIDADDAPLLRVTVEP